MGNIERSGINTETVKLVRDHYTSVYGTEKEDSPDSSRTTLRRHLRSISENLSSSDYVLDLGAGRQIFEKNYTQAYGEPNFNFVTLDVAHITYGKLLSRSKNQHVRASGDHLPFADESIAVVVSSMALDFMPKEVVNELFRVMEPNARALITLHHRDLVDSKLDSFKRRGRLGVGKARVKNFFEYLKQNDVLFGSSEQIDTLFEESGFIVSNVQLASDLHDKWWNVDLQKKSRALLEAEKAAKQRTTCDHKAGGEINQ